MSEPYRAEKELYSCGGDEFEEMTVAEMIAWLQGIAEGQPYGPDEITFRIRQGGDSWDGYNLAEITIVRTETAEEAVEREAQWEESRRRRAREQEA